MGASECHLGLFRGPSPCVLEVCPSVVSCGSLPGWTWCSAIPGALFPGNHCRFSVMLNDSFKWHLRPSSCPFLPGHVLFLFICILITSKGATFKQEVHWGKRAFKGLVIPLICDYWTKIWPVLSLRLLGSFCSFNPWPVLTVYLCSKCRAELSILFFLRSRLFSWTPNLCHFNLHRGSLFLMLLLHLGFSLFLCGCGCVGVFVCFKKDSLLTILPGKSQKLNGNPKWWYPGWEEGAS